MRKKRLIALFLCLALILSGCAGTFVDIVDSYIGKPSAPSALAWPDPPVKSTPHYAALAYERPDTKALLRRIETAKNALGAKQMNAAFATYDTLLNDYEHFITMFCYAQLQLDLNVFDEFYSAEVPLLINDLLQFEMALDELSAAFVGAGYQKELDEHYGSGFCKQVAINAARNDEAVRELYHKDKELSNEYSRLRVGFTVEHKNAQWSYDELVKSPDYTKLRRKYCDEFSAAVWPLFDQMRTLRNQMAEISGYSSYAEYQYETYGRDYPPDQASLLYAAVKEHVVPLFSKLMREYFTHDVGGLYQETFPFWETLERMNPLMESFSSDLSLALDAMLERGLYDVEGRDSKRVGAYTTELRAYAAPFLFMYWDDTADSVTTFIHEMGHFSSSYSNREGYSYSQYEPLDLFEVESQGLEMLFIHYYDQLFEHSKEASLTTVLNLMYALIAGCMEDEFQQAFYANPSMDYDQVCDLYERLGEEYGVTENYVFEDTSWALIPHTFTSPLYYFSYAIAAVPAFELFSISADDFDAARGTYQALVRRDKNATLLETLAACGLSDPFSPETIGAVCDSIDLYFFH